MANAGNIWSGCKWAIPLAICLFASVALRKKLGPENAFDGFPLFWSKPTYASSTEHYASLWPLLINLAFWFVLALAIVEILRRAFPKGRGIKRFMLFLLWCIALVPGVWMFFAFGLAHSWNDWPEEGVVTYVEPECRLRIVTWEFDVSSSPLFPQCRT